MKVRYVDLGAQYAAQREKILAALDRAMASGRYILGEEVARFEAAMAKACNVKHCIGVANGTDALIIAMQALDIGPGDEVITVANSWISTTSAIILAGATPVYVDVNDDLNMNPALIEEAITSKTKAILPVHLTGRCADMDKILAIAHAYDLFVIEDAAQAIGASHHGQLAGEMGDVGCFSLHPLKNLNAMGDAGAITTNNDELAAKIRLLHNHGLEDRNNVSRWGHNSRLDVLQAAILNVRMADLDTVIEQRRANAAYYRRRLSGLVICPTDAADCRDTYHLFVIQTRRRDALKAWLSQHQISSAIHYPVPNHLQACCADLGFAKGDLPKTEQQADRILSLPVNQMLEQQQLEHVAQTIRAFFEEGP